MYQFIRKFLFRLTPEKAHHFALNTLQKANKVGLLKLCYKTPSNKRTVMGLEFPNPIGLAAGLDSNGTYVDALASLGFGFIEIGGVTPRAQPGNPTPRVFRLPEQEAIINRMGFCNKGADHMAQTLAKTNYHGILGINISKNRDTNNENAIDDYLYCVRTLRKYASYFTINISSPNTPGLRTLQKTEYLTPLLSALKHEQASIKETYHKYIPLVVKLSPDLSDDELKEVAGVLLANNIDGVIATNTSLHRDGIEDLKLAKEQGGLSGRPLNARSTALIKRLHELLGDTIPIIGSGGVMDAASAKEKFDAGAKLLQVYSGFVYRGPGIVRELAASDTPVMPA